MSSARDEILARIRAATAGTAASTTGTKAAVSAPPPRAYRHTDERPHDELVTLFCARVADYKAEVQRVSSAQLPHAIGEAAGRHGGRRVVIPAGLPDAWRPAELGLLTDDTTLTPRELDELDGVITGCTVAIAETGTIALTSSPHEGRRLLSLIPDLHICIVNTDQVVGTVPEAITQLGPIAGHDRRPITLISGPSATSDIELQRVEGVHGPRKLVVLVIEETA
jgi:L-lactate dehydrogenase complex protein LldG